MTDDAVMAATRHWLEQAVIGLNLCPFAKAVYVKNQVRLVVSHARHADDLLEELDRELDLLVATPSEEIDTTLLIHATLFDDFLDFNDFLEIAEGVVDEHELDGVIQLASCTTPSSPCSSTTPSATSRKSLKSRKSSNSVA